MGSLTDKSRVMRDKSLDKSSEDHNAALCLPESPSENPPLDEERLRLIKEYRKAKYEEKAVQTMDDSSSDSPSELSGYTSSTYTSDTTQPMDIRESKEYIAASDEERRRLKEKHDANVKRGRKPQMRRRLHQGKKSVALMSRDDNMRRTLMIEDWKRGDAFKNEAARHQQCRAAEDRARDLSRPGADGRKWSDIDQKALELQRINDDYIRLAVELLSKRKHKSYEGVLTLHYRANKVVDLLNFFDAQWREAYQRIWENAERIKEQRLHSAEPERIRGLDTEKEPKAAIRPAKRPKTNRPTPTKNPEAHPTKVEKPAKAPTLSQKLRRSERLLAKEAGRKH